MERKYERILFEVLVVLFVILAAVSGSSGLSGNTTAGLGALIWAAAAAYSGYRLGRFFPLPD
jgi:succinate-acetate transporter protein